MFSQPFTYAQPEVSLSIPAALTGEEGKSFRNARSVVKTIPAASGSGSGPSTTMLFSIPSGGNSFIRPNSMSLRMKVTVTLTGGAGVTWKFAGSAPTATDASDWGGAYSLLNRVNVSTSGVTMSYSNFNHYFNSVLTHVLTNGYIGGDLRQCGYCGVTKLATGNVDAEKSVYVDIPLLGLSCFNSQTAFPLCLLSSPVQLEILTESVVNAFSGATTAITNYSISEASIVYDSIEVEPSFVQALKASKAGGSFSFKCNDYISVGPWVPSNSERFTVGAGLSSLKAILYTEQLQANVATSLAEKCYVSNGLSSANFYVDGQQISINNQTDDSVAFIEMNRALQRINDPTTTSYLEPIANVTGTGSRTSYTNGNFLLGASTMIISDWGYSQTGIPASMVQLELNHSAAADQAVRWGNATAFAASNAYAFLLYDAMYSVDLASGMLSIRK